MGSSVAPEQWLAVRCHGSACHPQGVSPCLWVVMSRQAAPWNAPMCKLAALAGMTMLESVVEDARQLALQWDEPRRRLDRWVE